MAEAFLKQLAGDRFDVESGGIEPGSLNLLVVRVMREVGIDISGNTTKDVSGFLKEGRHFDFVVTVCDETAAERCPVFPGAAERLHWPFEDPSSLTGTDQAKLEQIRAIRDAIRRKVSEFSEELSPKRAC